MVHFLEASNLHKKYAGRAVVRDVGVRVEQGEIVGLLGPNGAGKTTSFYMIVGLIKADNGHIELSGEDITDYPIHKRALKGVGYLPQEASVFRDLTVEENIFAVLENRSLPGEKKKNLLNSLIKDFGLGHIRHSKGAALSGGERRRVEIARTLALEPKFVLLDEPFAGVDPLAVSDIQDIIVGLKERNIGVLITDHNVRETLGIVARAYIMSSGELLVSGTPEEIIKSEKARKFYLGEEFKM
ncbi:MAG: LPS export ABC transporter ATP-binding protein [Bdellovibrionales bacterium RIFOXYD12_FULL_39_22]|nr:MAG: LPS export ABC transporter ATP-binding protein [Bdellovibrionales bacterium RIFOXYB1_FULL_39_21]OFZ43100.1 MAG: LPS export ABC transporter ATP-binding protein [Bdellovibrionales bacterium RIFOXYC12_FULL_39_17]OFZ47838.1 MAG: LPS export ABC transporter ATP-binding protein [Bdellovibrionales bacterium RIFOXYC1_FULL_39_130]OFZ68804.1 MAG: LPS export ABC transporter ATP-binding protein [Bdellovibrionales bacterium RIFOXYC2_FULL_39_8]OFZ75618.1 MAG: LPS export ABC transporter ATP-binding pro